ncbi:MAG: hypothetical protein M0R77_00490 [Gammaproteobacteria bacterium]|nr:hypothetical protein [Acholeplasmataceae bacterium]MCK9529032.1 hypothetical protein [Gammaproteobacteria bacterium]
MSNPYLDKVFSVPEATPVVTEAELSTNVHEGVHPEDDFLSIDQEKVDRFLRYAEAAAKHSADTITQTATLISDLTQSIIILTKYVDGLVKENAKLKEEQKSIALQTASTQVHNEAKEVKEEFKPVEFLGSINEHQNKMRENSPLIKLNKLVYKYFSSEYINGGQGKIKPYTDGYRALIFNDLKKHPVVEARALLEVINELISRELADHGIMFLSDELAINKAVLIWNSSYAVVVSNITHTQLGITPVGLNGERFTFNSLEEINGFEDLLARF